jgi:hypothetical protein
MAISHFSGMDQRAIHSAMDSRSMLKTTGAISGRTWPTDEGNMTSKPPVKIRVKLGAATNIARAGTGKQAKIASSTSSGFYAAQLAATKFFDRPQWEIRLRRLQKGDVCANKPEIYTAFVE